MPANGRRPALFGMVAVALLSVSACGANVSTAPEGSIPVAATAAPSPSVAAAGSPAPEPAVNLAAEAVIDVPGAKGAIAIAAGPDAVWIGGDGEVIRVDPTDNSTTSVPVPIADGSWTGIYLDRDQLWASDFYGNALVHVDLPSQRAVRITTDHPTGPAWSTVGIWLAAEGSGTLSRVQPATDTIDLTLRPSGARKYPSVIDDRVWHGDTVDGVPWAVQRDASTGEEISRVELPEWSGCYFLPGTEGLVWTLGACNGDSRNALAVIDPSTSTVTSLDAPKAFLGTIVLVDDTTWLLVGIIADQPARLIEFTKDGPTGRVIKLPVGLDPDNPVVAFGSIWIPSDAQGKVFRFPIEDLGAG